MTKSIQPTSGNLTEIKPFKPTPGMIVWLDTAVQLQTDVITDISQACEISRTAWYDWLKQEGFIEWFNEEWKKKLRSHAFRLDVIGLNRAKRGDYNFWKDMQRRVGNDTEEFSEEATFSWRKK
jgi:hypothetical protein